MTDDSYLRLSGINKSFGKFEALKDIALEVRRGELMVFLGPPAAARPRCCASSPASKRRIRERSTRMGGTFRGLPAIRRDYGIVFQSYALFPNLTIRANVAYGLVNRRQARGAIAARVAELA